MPLLMGFERFNEKKRSRGSSSIHTVRLVYRVYLYHDVDEGAFRSVSNTTSIYKVTRLFSEAHTNTAPFVWFMWRHAWRRVDDAGVLSRGVHLRGNGCLQLDTHDGRIYIHSTISPRPGTPRRWWLPCVVVGSRARCDVTQTQPPQTHLLRCLHL